jgi:hypothetical protein
MTPLSHAQTAIKEYPPKITAKEFLEMIAENPSIFEQWNTPLEITEYVDCSDSNITYLSPHLTFSGRNEDGDTADFSHCPNLTSATGTFHSCVNFFGSGIVKIENLTVTQPNEYGKSANFGYCPFLQIATGSYPGYVNFEHSGIEHIKHLVAESYSFKDCFNLQNLKEWEISQRDSAKITAHEFYDMILENPSVFEHWETPLEIIEYVDCNKISWPENLLQPDNYCPITHLSKHLTFSGRNPIGHVANFENCLELETATGNFEGFVNFKSSNIKKIEALNITKPDIYGEAVSFAYCSNLTLATGTYPGNVDLEYSNVEKTENLIIKDQQGRGLYIKNTPIFKNILSETKNLTKITALEFYVMLCDNPSVFEHWDTPLEITESVDCSQSPITHLSPHLTFSGRNETGEGANFRSCKNLQTATGNFKGSVDFSESGVEKIENLNVGKDNNQNSGWFYNCKNLKIATGNFEGFVNFKDTYIEKIENLNVGYEGTSPIDFSNFWSLEIVKNSNFKGHVDFSNSNIKHIENLNIGKNENGESANFRRCKAVEILTSNFEGFVNLRNSRIKNIKTLNIKNPRKDGCYTCLLACDNLETLEGWDLSKPIEIEPAKLEAEKERIALKKFHKETEPTALPFL